MSDRVPSSRRRRRTASSALRSVVGGTLLLARRRARRDLPLLVAWTALAAFAVLLAIAGPRQLTGSLDAGAVEAVETAGSDADIVVHTPVGDPEALTSVPLTAPDDVVELADTVQANLPPALAGTVQDSTVSVVGPESLVNPDSVVPPLPRGVSLQLQLAMLTEENSAGLELIDGALPAEAPATDPIQVVITADAARSATIGVGSVISAPVVASSDIPLVVVGIVDLADPDAAVWRDLPRGFTSAAPPTSGDPVPVTALTIPSGVSRASMSYLDPFDGGIRFSLNPAAFTSDLVGAVSAETDGLEANSTALTAGSGDSITVQTGFATALSGFAGAARAATAQMSMMAVGVIGVAASVLLLLSGLIIARRSGEIALERARGGSIASVVARAALESAVLTAIAVTVGVAVAVAIGPVHTAPDPTLAVIVAVVALIATPFTTWLTAWRLRTGRRAPANRRDRAAIVQVRRARRVAVELTVAALAVGAVVSFTGRGLLQGSTDGIDPLLASTPLLAAGLVTILVLRVYRWPVRLIGTIARRSRGLLGLIGAARAERAPAALPALALTLAVGLAATAGLLTATVDAGQVDASWERVGADVRVDGDVTEQDAETVADTAGVSAAVSARLPRVEVSVGGSSLNRTVLAVDRGYPDVVTALPDGIRPAPTAVAALRTLGDVAASDPLPVVVDARLAQRVTGSELAMTVDGDRVPLEIVGTTDAGPSGYRTGPFVYVDLDALSERMPTSVAADTLLAVGAGATSAVDDLDVAGATVLTRSSWLHEWRDRAIVSGVYRVFLLSAVALALLAMVALIATTLAGARDRARSLSLLRTLGSSSRLGWWLALSELVPVVVAALIGGIATGIGVALLLGPSLGLAALTGGTLAPPIVIAAPGIAGLAGAAGLLLLVGVATETALRRRDRLNDVLRVGETL